MMRFDEPVKATRIWFNVADNGIQVDVILSFQSFSCHVSCLAISIPVYCWSGFLLDTFCECLHSWMAHFSQQQKGPLVWTFTSSHLLDLYLGQTQKSCAGRGLSQHVVGHSHLYCKGRVCGLEYAWQLVLVVHWTTLCNPRRTQRSTLL